MFQFSLFSLLSQMHYRLYLWSWVIQPELTTRYFTEQYAAAGHKKETPGGRRALWGWVLAASSHSHIPAPCLSHGLVAFITHHVLSLPLFRCPSAAPYSFCWTCPWLSSPFTDCTSRDSLLYTWPENLTLWAHLWSFLFLHFVQWQDEQPASFIMSVVLPEMFASIRCTVIQPLL